MNAAYFVYRFVQGRGGAQGQESGPQGHAGHRRLERGRQEVFRHGRVKGLQRKVHQGNWTTLKIIIVSHSDDIDIDIVL